jgi:hypothetical protein
VKIVKHKKDKELEKYSGNKTILFYEEVMRTKGPETEAYTIEIGGKNSQKPIITFMIMGYQKRNNHLQNLVETYIR